MKKLRLAIFGLYLLFPVIMFLIEKETRWGDWYDVFIYWFFAIVSFILLELILILTYIYKKNRSLIKTIINFIVIFVISWIIIGWLVATLEVGWIFISYLFIGLLLMYVTGFRIYNSASLPEKKLDNESVGEFNNKSIQKLDNKLTQSFEKNKEVILTFFTFLISLVSIFIIEEFYGDIVFFILIGLILLSWFYWYKRKYHIALRLLFLPILIFSPLLRYFSYDLLILISVWFLWYYFVSKNKNKSE